MAYLAPGGVPRNARTEIVLPKSRLHLHREVALQGWSDFQRASVSSSAPGWGADAEQFRMNKYPGALTKTLSDRVTGAEEIRPLVMEWLGQA